MTVTQILIQTAAAFAGTIAFALLFGVPKQYYIACGINAGLGWLLYCILFTVGLSATESTFFASFLVVVLSKFTAVFKKCPITVFITTGIFPLIPGAGIYWTAYYLVMGESEQAFHSGFGAVKAVFAIVLGIILVEEIPKKLFSKIRRQKPVDKQ